MSKKETTAGEYKYVTPSKIEIAELKKKHGEIHEIQVEGTDLACLIRKPTMRELEVAMAQGQKSPLAFNKSLLNNCWIMGDEEIKTNDDNFLAACSQIGEIVDVKTASIKKL